MSGWNTTETKKSQLYVNTNEFPTENWALGSLELDRVGKYLSLSSVRRVYSLWKVCVVQCLKQALKRKQGINQ